MTDSSPEMEEAGAAKRHVTQEEDMQSKETEEVKQTSMDDEEETVTSTDGVRKRTVKLVNEGEG